MKQNKTIIVLVIIIVLALGYIGYDFIQEKLDEKYFEFYQSGYIQSNIDIENSFLPLLQCQQIPISLNVNNQTQQITLFAVECLNQGQ